MAEFHEGRLPVNVRMGATYNDEFAVQIVTTASGKEYRRLVHPFPVRSFQINFTNWRSTIAQGVLAMYSRVYGMYAGFRVRCEDDFSTNGSVNVPTAGDWQLPLVSTGVYQLVTAYGSGGTPITLGLPYRKVYKPVAGSTIVAVGAVQLDSSNFTVDTTNGRVTFLANGTWAITNITKAVQAVLTIPGNALVAGRSIYVTGVVGMTQINNKRVTVVSTAIGGLVTINLDTTAYSNYTSGGAVNTAPQVGEVVSGGCYFDLPCRFNSKIDVAAISEGVRDCGGIDIIELIDP